MPAPQPDPQALGSQTPTGSSIPLCACGSGHVYLSAIKAYVAAERIDVDRDTHSGQNAYDALKAAKALLYRLADEA